MTFLFWVYESEPWLKPALSRAALRSAAHYGSGLAPEPGTPSADLSRAKPRPAEPRQHYRWFPEEGKSASKVFKFGKQLKSDHQSASKEVKPQKRLQSDRESACNFSDVEDSTEDNFSMGSQD